MSHLPRVPLHLQGHANIAKAIDKNPSYESFRPNVIHQMGSYKDMDDRATVSEQYRMRRYPNGQLDYMWAANQLIDAIKKLKYNGKTGDPNIGSASLLPIEMALLTVCFPGKYKKIEPMQAEILTQLSDSEKSVLAALVDKHLRDVENYNAGQGGGAVPGSFPNDVGG